MPRLLLIALTAVIATSGCGIDVAEPDNPVQSAGAAEVIASWQDDDAMTAIWGRSIAGGFGGLFYDSGRPILLLKNLVNADQARGQVASALSRSGYRVDPAGVEVRQARYSFDELREVALLIQPLWSKFPLHMMDIDEKENVVYVGVEAGSIPALAKAIHAIVPDWEAKVVIAATEMAARDLDSLWHTIRPMPGGVYVGPYGCTLGFNADHYLYGASVMTAAHCTRSIAVVNGDTISQSAYNSQNYVAVEVMDPPAFTGSTLGCPSGKRCRRSDAALFSLLSGVTRDNGMIARPLPGTTAIDPNNPRFVIGASLGCWMWPYSPCWTPKVGDVVTKVGWVTGLTTGTVTRSCVTRGQTGTDILFTCQYDANYASDGGDSGGPVFKGDLLYGIHWGGGTGDRTFSSINQIRAEFGSAGATCEGLIVNGFGWFQC